MRSALLAVMNGQRARRPLMGDVRIFEENSTGAHLRQVSFSATALGERSRRQRCAKLEGSCVEQVPRAKSVPWRRRSTGKAEHHRSSRRIGKSDLHQIFVILKNISNWAYLSNLNPYGNTSFKESTKTPPSFPSKTIFVSSSLMANSLIHCLQAPQGIHSFWFGE